MAHSSKRPGTPLGRGYRSSLSSQAARWALPRLIKNLGPRLRPLRSPGRMASNSQSAALIYFQPRSLKTVVQFATLSLLVLLAGGAALLWQIQQGGQRSQASGSSVIGQPSLPAATVDHILARMGSPMVGTGRVVAQTASQANIDDAFALAVWWTETNDGAAGVGSADRNPGSVRGSPGYPSAFDGYTIYPSYAAAIKDWFNVLRTRYISRGLTTVYAISGPYVGTSSSGLWAGKVMALMMNYRGEAPPKPKPTPTPATIAGKVAAVAGKAQPQATPVSSGMQPQPVAPKTLTTVQRPAAIPGLPRPLELLIVCFGLLLALAIAGWAYYLERALLARRVREPVTSALPLGQVDFTPLLPDVDTESLPSVPLFPGRFSPLPSKGPLSREPQTEAPIRRIVLLPGHNVALPSGRLKEPVAVEARPAGGGLLSRYGDTQGG